MIVPEVVCCSHAKFHLFMGVARLVTRLILAWLKDLVVIDSSYFLKIQ
jgi:hypothetical protein